MPFRGFGRAGRVALQDPAQSGRNAELAAPIFPDGPTLPVGASVVDYRSGPGDENTADEAWLFDIRSAPHDGVMVGKQLMAMLPDVPPEGHGGFDFPTNAPGAFIDSSTTQRYNKWSDWQSSVPRHQFQGSHVTVFRLAPGSWQGYQGANQMIGPNVDRNAPAPWDQTIIVGGGGT